MLLKGTSGLAELQLYLNGTPTESEAEPVSVSVVDAAGNTVVASTNATDEAEVGRYTYTLLPAHTVELDLLTATWGFTLGGVAQTTTTQVEVIGAQLFTEYEARQYKTNPEGTAGALANETRYPDQKIAEARDLILEEFTNILGFSPVPRYARILIDGSNDARLMLSPIELRTVRRAAITDGSGVVEVLDAGELADITVYSYGTLVRRTLGTWLLGTQNIILDIEHGLDKPPLAIKDAALRVLVDMLVPSAISERATSQTDETGSRTIKRADDKDSWYGLPRVDGILKRWRTIGVGFA